MFTNSSYTPNKHCDTDELKSVILRLGPSVCLFRPRALHVAPVKCSKHTDRVNRHLRSNDFKGNFEGCNSEVECEGEGEGQGERDGGV